MLLQMHAVSIHTNVVGGMTMGEPANDLAIAVAIASSYYEQPIARDIVCIGEVGTSSDSPLACLLTHVQILRLLLLRWQSITLLVVVTPTFVLSSPL